MSDNQATLRHKKLHQINIGWSFNPVWFGPGFVILGLTSGLYYSKN